MKKYITSENIFRVLAIINYIFYFMSYNSVFLFNAGLLLLATSIVFMAKKDK